MSTISSGRVLSAACRGSVLAGCMLAFLGALAAPVPADACCPAYAHDARVAIADQEILIVWDEERKVEHFVRRAGFETTTKRDFGFLVPTPTKPTLAEAPSAVFDTLAAATQPVPKNQYEVNLIPLILYPLLLMRSSSHIVAASASAVRVLDRQTVAGYDAAILDADDAEALTRWLRDNGYDARPEIEEWAKPYVAARWKITAFKYAAAEPEPGTPVSTGSVRLSFATDRPLFPYRVPTDQLAKPGAGHLLRVFFVSDARFNGTLGAAASPWMAAVQYAAPIDGLAAKVAGATPQESLAKATWVTVFEDTTWPSARDDLFFGRANESKTVVPTYPVPSTIPMPLDVLALIGFVAFRMIKKHRRA